MGTIQEKLAYLNDTKSLIRNAIIDKGVAVSTTDTFRSYAEKIGLIQSGGSSESGGLDLGPYTDPTIDYNITNQTSEYPSLITTPPEQEEYVKDPDWWDIETILDTDTEDYPAKMIILYPNDDATIALSGANFYRTSDGTTYTATSLSATQNHTWDRSFDKVSEKGYGYRYVIYYFSSNTGITYLTRAVEDNAIAVITKGFKWAASSSQEFYQKYRLRYLKLKDSDWSLCTSVNGFCRECWNLEYAELDFNNGNAFLEPITNMTYMFYQCYSLQWVKFSYPEVSYDYRYMFQYCSSLKHLELDFSHRDNGAPSSNWHQALSGVTLNTCIVTLKQDQDVSAYKPWVKIKTDVPIKVNSISFRNMYQSTSTYSVNYPLEAVEIEASADNLTWTKVGEIKIASQKQSATSSATLNLETAYSYWRFKARFLNYSCDSIFSIRNINFDATYLQESEVEGEPVSEWIAWTKPTFTSNSQDGCEIAASSNQTSAYNAFTTSTTNWSSVQCNISTGSYTGREYSLHLSSQFYNGSGTHEYLYIKGSHNTSYFRIECCQFKYVVFENTSNFTSMSYAFAGTSENSSELIGCIIPDVEKVTNWECAFYYCADLIVAPQIEFSSSVESVEYLLGHSGVEDITHLDFTYLPTAKALFASTDLKEFSISLPEAIDLDSICQNMDSLERCSIEAPKARSMNQAFRSGIRTNDSSNPGYTQTDDDALKYVRVFGFNKEENAEVDVPWTRPNWTSTTSYGTLTTNGTIANYSSSRPYQIFDSSNSITNISSTTWYTRQYAFTGNGSIIWQFEEGVTPSVSKIRFNPGQNTATTTGTYKCRFYADADKSIPLTDEITVDKSVYTTFELDVLNGPVTISSLVIDITENENYATIMDVNFDATVKASGYMTDLSYCFYGSAVNNIDIDTSKVTNMNYAFAYCYNLLEVPNISFASVTDMRYAFQGCLGLTEINDVEFPVAVDVTGIFSYCDSLASVDGLSLPECITASSIFISCQSLVSVHQPNWLKVQNLASAFQYCTYMKELDISNLTTVTDCSNICYGNYLLAKAKLPETSTKTTLYQAFYHCYALRQVTLGDVSNVTTMEEAFYQCYKLISVSSMALNSCTTMLNAFYQCSWLEGITITNLDSVESMDYAFYNCFSLKTVTLPDMPVCTNAKYAFQSCRSLTSLSVGETPLCTSMIGICNGCSSLITTSFADTSRVDDFSSAFSGASSLTTASLDTSYATDVGSMFYNCTNLKTAPTLDLTRCTNAGSLFRNCSSLTSCSFTNATKIEDASYMFFDCTSLASISMLDDFDFSATTTMNYMFEACNSLPAIIDLTSWNISSSCTLISMFRDCENLEELYLSFGSRTGSMSSICSGCSKLKVLDIQHTGNVSTLSGLYAGTPFTSLTVDLTTWTTSSSLPTITSLFDGCPNLETVILNLGNKYLAVNGTTGVGYLFRSCPKLKSISISGASSLHRYNSMFVSMNNTEECTIDWNNSIIPYDSVWERSFYDKSNAPIKHINMKLEESDPAWRAFNSSYPTGYISEPCYEEAQINLKLPQTVQVQGLSFTQRSGGTHDYAFPTTARFYSDIDCTVPISAELVLETTANSVTEAEVSNVVTDTISCKFGQELGAYLGVGQIGIKAKVKANQTRTKWVQPIYGDGDWTFGTIISNSTYRGNPYYITNGTYSTSNSTSYGWFANSTTASLTWTFPENVELVIKRIAVRTPYYSNTSYYPLVGQFFTDSSMETPIGDDFSITRNTRYTVAGIPEDGIRTKCLFFKKNGGASRAGIDEIYIDADIITTEYLPWSTPEETWTENEVWSQPIPSSNTSDGTFSASTEQEGSEAYLSTSTGWLSAETDSSPYIKWQLPKTLDLYGLSFESSDIATCQVFSDDGITQLGSDLSVKGSRFNLDLGTPLTAVASNFDFDDYIVAMCHNNNAEQKVSSFSLEVEFDTGADLSGYQYIVGNTTSSYSQPSIYTYNGELRSEVPITPTLHVGTISGTTLQPSTHYYAKISWAGVGNPINLELSTDGLQYDVVGSQETAEEQLYWLGNFRIGVSLTAYPWSGTINLMGIKAYIDGSLAWSYTGRSSVSVEGFPDVAATYENIPEVSTIYIKPLTRQDGEAFGTNSVGISSLKLYANHDVNYSNIVDYEMPELTATDLKGCEVSATPGQISVYNSSSYQSNYAASYYRANEFYAPPIFGALSYMQRLFDGTGSSSTTRIADDQTLKIIHDLDFYGVSTLHPSYISSWFNTYDNQLLPFIFKNPKNIDGSINLSSLTDLTHDSIIELIGALISRKGRTACTLTLGSVNLAKISDEEKAVATNKNWNLA